MNKYEKLLKNTKMIMLSNLGIKILSIILVPFYTYFLTKEEYGIIDIMMNIVTLLVPIISFNIADSVLRFSIDEKNNSASVLKIGFVISFRGIFFIILLSIIIISYIKINNINTYIWMLLLIIISQIFNTILLQFAKGIGKFNEFILGGLFNSIIVLLLNIIFISKLYLGINGYGYSLIIGNIISCFYIVYKLKILKILKHAYIDTKLCNEMIKYSLPLIPNSIMWWIMNAIDRYFILGIVGVSGNGLYAVSNKVPTLLNIMNSIFIQAWQVSVIEEYNSEDRDIFQTNMFSVLSKVMILSVSFILIFIKFLIISVFSYEFIDAWKSVPFLLLSSMFSSFSSFFGSNYCAMKKTNGILRTSIIGGLINIIFNIILIPKFGLVGAAISTTLSFFIVWLIRVYDVKKYINVQIDKSRFLISNIIIFFQICILYLNIKYDLLINLILFLINLLINYDIIVLFVKRMYYKYTNKL